MEAQKRKERGGGSISEGDEPINVHYGQDRVGKFFRRFMHLATGASVIYYLVPHTVLGIPREGLVIICYFFLPVLVEFIRNKKGLVWSGLREHERGQLASYFWFLWATGTTLLFFPQFIAAPLILATAIGDVFIGETRPLRRRYNWGGSTLVMSAIFIPFWVTTDTWYMIFMCLVAGGLMFLVENLKITLDMSVRQDFFFSRSRKVTSELASKARMSLHLDDDLLLQLVPALLFSMLFALFAIFSLHWLIPSGEVLTPTLSSWP